MDVVERRRELWKLLSNLKITVEGLLSTNNPNVWSRYGGLQRLHKDMNNILCHGLKHEQVYLKQKDYWRFVWCLRYISPKLAPHVEQVLAKRICGVQSHGEGYKAERWLLHSLQGHLLSTQLKPLLKNQANMRKYYNDEAFLLSEPHVSAMFQCLEAVEQNNPRLLALIDTVRVKACSSVEEAPWECGHGDQSAIDTGIPYVSLTEPLYPAQHEVGDSVDGNGDDGPEYLAIGNLGGRVRRDSSSSVHSSEHAQINGQTPVAPAPARRNSFSDTQSGKRRSFKGHTRSLSDTGVMQKHKEGEHEQRRQCVVLRTEACLALLNMCYATYLHDCVDGFQYSCIPDGMFRKPLEGQSLISYLSEQDFGSCADLEKENAHFSISESLISAIELMKCNMCRRAEEAEEDGDSDCEIQQLKQKIRLRRQQIRHSRLQLPGFSQQAVPSTDSCGSQRSSQDSIYHSDFGSAEDAENIEIRDADIKASATPCSRSFLSSDSVSPSFLQSNSAESVAMGLLRQFEGMQLPAASELEWLVPEHDAPQKLLPIPDSLPISPDDGEHADIYKLRIRVRGNLEWAPPRPQIIFNIHPAPKRKVVVAKQNYRCAGCGTRIDPDYIKRLRYCEYLGRYFCQCCHENAVSVVPSRILRKWDFSKYNVSNFARDLLGKIAGDPLFNPNDINSSLYKKVKALEAVRVLRVQLYHMKNLFKTCRLAKEVLDQFDTIPGHLTEDLHLFSLNDLIAVRSGDLTPKLRELLRLGSTHVAGCVLCQAKGFVCEFCGNEKDIIFAYELNKCQRCEECSACYHRTCFRNSKECPRCQRLAERRERMARRNMEEQEEDDGGGV
uniref:RUN domain-containing protein n=1 Tax=Electrophorus electricus TaxID=8005 RepID=A0A4W4E6K3_ELEEL